MKRDKTPIEKILEAASESNLVHFPHGLILYRIGDNWTATIVKASVDCAAGLTPHAGGESPEAAVEALGKMIAKRLQDDMMSKRRDASKLETALALLAVSP